VVVHGHGNHDLKPIFDAVHAAFFEQRVDPVEPVRDLTVITCNNGHPSLGLLEKSAELLGVDVVVAGADRKEWVNAVDKPLAILEALDLVETKFTMYADSRDCILIGTPQRAIDSFRSDFPGKQLIFGADIVNWPPVSRFAKYEKQLSGSNVSRYRFLNGGCWIGRTSFCRGFFEEVLEGDPVSEAPDSEQGLLKALLPRFPDEIGLDYGTRIFFNCGFVAGDIIEIKK